MFPYTTNDLVVESIHREIDASASGPRIYTSKPSGFFQQLRWRAASGLTALR